MRPTSALVVSLALALVVLPALVAHAGNPHFVSCALVSSNGQVCIEAKEAGLGDEEQIVATLQVVAHCQNPGGNNPQAENKETFETSSTQPVQNGRAEYTMCVTPSFSPSCSPPMTVVVDSIVVFDETNSISCVLQ